MKILVISSCTGKKKYSRSNCLRQEDFAKGSFFLQNREKELLYYIVSAEKMYEGQQHKKILDGINYVTNKTNAIDIDFYILSAGYGLIKSNKLIAPYECTFSTMKKKEITQWASFLNIPEDVYYLINGRYDLVLFALGDKYLEACNFKPNSIIKNKTIFFCSYKIVNKLPNSSYVLKIPLGNNEAKQYKCVLIGLKGKLISQLLMKLADINSPSNLIDSMFTENIYKLEL